MLNMIWVILPVCLGKVVMKTIQLTPNSEWSYFSKFGLGIGKGNWEVSARLLAKSSDDFYLNATAFIDQDWEKYRNLEVCQNLPKTTRIPVLVPFSGEWSLPVQKKLKEADSPHMWYFSVFSCGVKQKTKLQVQMRFTDQQGSEFSFEQQNLILTYVLMLACFSAAMLHNYKSIQLYAKKEDEIDPRLLLLLYSVGCELLSVVLESFHLWLFSHNGRGIEILSFLSQVLDVSSQLLTSTLLILLATGWGIKYKELPSPETYMPISLFMLLIYVIVIGVAKVTQDSDYRFSLYEGGPGLLLVTLRMVMWGFFLFCVCNVYPTLSGEALAFMLNFAFAGSMYFLAIPIMSLYSLILPSYTRYSFITTGCFLIQLLSQVITSSLFTKQSRYFKISSFFKSALPGIVN